jgi:hypothetical protein
MIKMAFCVPSSSDAGINERVSDPSTAREAVKRDGKNVGWVIEVAAVVTGISAAILAVTVALAPHNVATERAKLRVVGIKRVIFIINASPPPVHDLVSLRCGQAPRLFLTKTALLA